MYRDLAAILGDAVGQVFASGVGDLEDIVNNLTAIMEHYEQNKGSDVTGVLGIWCTVFGMTQMKKEKMKQVRCPIVLYVVTLVQHRPTVQMYTRRVLDTWSVTRHNTSVADANRPWVVVRTSSCDTNHLVNALNVCFVCAPTCSSKLVDFQANNDTVMATNNYDAKSVLSSRLGLASVINLVVMLRPYLDLFNFVFPGAYFGSHCECTRQRGDGTRGN